MARDPKIPRVERVFEHYRLSVEAGAMAYEALLPVIRCQTLASPDLVMESKIAALKKTVGACT